MTTIGRRRRKRDRKWTRDAVFIHSSPTCKERYLVHTGERREITPICTLAEQGEIVALSIISSSTSIFDMMTQKCAVVGPTRVHFP